MKYTLIINGYTKQLLILFIISVFFAGCRNDDIVDDENKFAAVYVDLVMVNEQFQGDTTVIHAKTDSIFRTHGVTEEQYRTTLKYYEENPEKWKEFFQRAESYLKEKRRNR